MQDFEPFLGISIGQKIIGKYLWKEVRASESIIAVLPL